MNIGLSLDYMNKSGKVLLIYSLGFFGAASGGLLAFGMIFYLREVFGASQLQIGFFASLWSMSYIAGCLCLKKIHGRFYPKHILMTVASIFLLIALSLVFAKSFVLVFVLYALLGISTSLYWPVMTGWLSAGYESKRLGKIMSGYNFSWSTGTIISPFLGGVLSELSPIYPLYAVCCMYALNAFLLLGAMLLSPVIINDKSYLRVEGDKPENRKGSKDESSPLRFVGWLGIFIAFVSFAAIVNIFPIYGKEALEIPKSTIGFLLLVRAFFTTLAFLIMGTTSFWQFNSLQMKLVTAGLAVCMLCMNFFYTPFAFFVILPFIGLFFGAAYFNSQFHGVAGSVNRSARAATHEVLLSVGMALGSIGGGFVYQRFSMSAVYYISVGILVGGLLAQQILSCKFKKAALTG